jgi:cysteine desulfurase
MARAGRKVLVSAVEHPSIASLGAALSTMGAVFETLPVDVNGRVCLDRLEAGLEEGNVSLVSVMLVNNETGVIQPVPEIAAICRRHSVPMHSDAVQAVGKIPVSFRELDVDLMTVTPHKYYGPRGIGMLIHRAGVSLTPLLHGGFQQGGIRPGTEDVALAVGAHLATSLAVKGQPTHAADLVRLRDAFLESLRIALVGDCVLNGNGARRSPHTLNVAFPGVDRQTLMIAADVAGIAVSTGSACSSGSSEVSAVLLAMGVKRSILESSIRVSFGRGNSLDDVHAAATRIAQIVNDLRG